MRRAYLVPLVAIFAVLAALGLAYGVEGMADVVWAPVVALVVIEVVLMVLAVIARPDRRLPILCDPVALFVAFQAQFFVVGPLALKYTTFYSGTPVPTRIVTLTVLGFIGLLAAFLVGYHSPVAAVVASVLPAFDRGKRKLPGRWAETALLLGCLAACATYVSNQGGIVAMLHRGYGTGDSPAMYTAAFLVLVLVTFLMAWRIFGSASPSTGDIVFFVLLLLCEAVFWGVLLGTRKWLFHLFFGVTGIFLLRRGARAIPRLLLPSMLALLLAYLSLWGVVRGRPIASFMSDYADPRYADIASPQSGYIEGVASPFGAACLVLEVFPEIEPYRYGETVLVALLSPIPRAVWPDKPIGMGKELTRYLGPYYAFLYDPTKGLSITPTLVGDFYANMGVFGIVFGGLVFGFICRVVAVYAVTGMRDGLQYTPARVLVAAVFIAGLVELRADSAMLVLFYMYTLLPLLALLTFFNFDTEPQRG